MITSFALAVLIMVPTIWSDKIPLHIASLIPLAEDDGFSARFGRASFAGMQIALRDINNRSDILPEYELNIVLNDTKGNTGHALISFFEMMFKPPTKIALIGPLLSLVTENLAEVASLWKLVQISPGASTPLVSNRERYHYFHRTISSAAEMEEARIEMMKEFGWTRAAFIFETAEPHSSVIDRALALMEANNLTVLLTQSFYRDPSLAIQRIKEKDARIIVGHFFQTEAVKVFCHAYHQQLYGRNIVWFLPGYYSDGWWAVGDPANGCTGDQLREASQGYLSITFSMFARNDQRSTISGKTSAEFREEVGEMLGVTLKKESQETPAYAYDALWVLALALNATQNAIAPRRLEDYSYDDIDIADELLRQVHETKFFGASGEIQFNEYGFPPGEFLIKQDRDDAEMVIGTFKHGQQINWLISTEEIWAKTGGEPPFDSDKTVTITKLQSISPSLFNTFCVIAPLGILTAFSFIGFNMLFRQNKQIKMSSPKINNIISSGFITAYIFVILLGVDRRLVSERVYPVVCRIRNWMLAMGFTFAFGGMFTKMWRVYSIVIHNKRKRKVIKDRQLFGIVIGLLLIDLCILIPWEIIDPVYALEDIVTLQQTQEDIEHHRKYELLYVQCTSKNHNIWLMAFMIYKAFVIVFGVFLAWQTRDVKVPGLNDSYYVGLSIYNTVLCSVVGVPLSTLNARALGVTYGLVAGLILFCTTSSLAMLYFPKVKAVYLKVSDDNETFMTNQSVTKPSSRVEPPRSATFTTDAMSVAATNSYGQTK